FQRRGWRIRLSSFLWRTWKASSQRGSIAECRPTGTVTRPKLMAPFQSARGMRSYAANAVPATVVPPAWPLPQATKYGESPPIAISREDSQAPAIPEGAREGEVKRARTPLDHWPWADCRCLRDALDGVGHLP